MFRKHMNSENTNVPSDDKRSDDFLSSSDGFDPFDGFDELEKKKLASIHFSDQLQTDSDSTWSDMMDEYNELEPDNHRHSGQFRSRSFADDRTVDNKSGDFDNDFDTDPDSGFGNDFDSSTESESVNSEKKDFDEYNDFNDFKDDNDGNDCNDGQEEEQKAFLDQKTFVRLIVALMAVIFGLGVLMMIKITNSTTDDYTPHYVSDSSMTGSQEESPSSEEPSGEKSSSEEPPAVSSEKEKKVYKELTVGNAGDEVLALQTRLKDLGYISPKSCTGYYGEYTAKIIKRFQVKAGLTQTGIADQATQEKLYSEDAPRFS